MEANKYSRKLYPGWIEARGFLFSPDVFTSTELDKLAARLCQCHACKELRRPTGVAA